MTADEVLKAVQCNLASRPFVPDDEYPVVFSEPELEIRPRIVEMFRDEFPGLPVRRGIWFVYGTWQLPPGMSASPSGPTYLVDDETGTVAPFLVL